MIIKKLHSFSLTCPFPLKLPMLEGRMKDEAFIEDLLLNSHGIFRRPEPITGSRLAVEVQHRGLGEDRPRDNSSTLRRRKLLQDRSDRSRRHRRDYYELLLHELEESAESLGKREGPRSLVNPLGAPQTPCQPRELLRLLLPRQLGNYPTPPGIPATRLRALGDVSLFEKKRVLELGCGDGAFLLEIVRECKPAFTKGVDADSDLIESAARQSRERREMANSQAGPTLEEDLSWVPVCFQTRANL